MTKVRVEIPPKLVPVFTGPARYRGAYGGRGSGKTRTFAKMAAVWGYRIAASGRTGIILCGREYQNSLDESSMAEVKEAILSEQWLSDVYEVGEKYIRTKDHLAGRLDFKFAGLRQNIDSIKSKSRIFVLWVDEAEPVSEEAWRKITPTVREQDSEIWVTWNPELEDSATHKRFRLDPPSSSKIVQINYVDNPWFPDVLEQERLDDLAKRPEQYEHIWGGDFITVVEGAYYAHALTIAKEQNRIGFVPEDPLMTKRAFFDIGGSGRKADATAIWIAQFIGPEIRVLDYYEAQGQPLSTHLNWMRKKGYTTDCTTVTLPHDGDHGEKVIDASYRSALEDAGYDVEVVPNMGRGAAMDRVETARRVFPRIRFNEEATAGGRKALGWYHEKIDKDRRIGLGPEHDWSSHAADAFGMMCICFEDMPAASDLPQIDDAYQAAI